MSKHLEGKDRDHTGPLADGRDVSAVGDTAGSDGELVLAARKGQLAAFDQLVRRYQRKATSVAYRLLNNLDDAMEVTQDAFVNAYGKLDSLSQPERFGSWLLRIVGNLALNRRRARTLRKAISLDAGGDGGQAEGRSELDVPDISLVQPDEAASAEDVRRLIDEGLAELPDTQRQALVLFSVENMPQKEVADILGCSVEAVKWHVFTARKKLKERLKDYL